jgi:deazaflavin-dependent oxidoreductase (nitroreductase family)
MCAMSAFVPVDRDRVRPSDRQCSRPSGVRGRSTGVSRHECCFCLSDGTPEGHADRRRPSVKNMAVRGYEEASGLQRVLRRFGTTAPGSWVLARTLHHLDGAMYRISGGRTTAAGSVVGIPTAMLTTRGARTGRRRTVPVLAVPIPGGWGLVGSSFGRQHHPGWYHNLRANPDAVLDVEGQRVEVLARQVHGPERDAVREAALRIYPGYVVYEHRASSRDLGYFVLRPKPPG